MKENQYKNLEGQGRTSKDFDKDKTPELPERDYLEDIDFVTQEFDLFFKRPPEVPSRLTEAEGSKEKEGGTELKLMYSSEQSTIMDKSATEESHYMPLMKTSRKDDDSSESAYQSLQPRKQPSLYVNFTIISEDSKEDC